MNQFCPNKVPSHLSAAHSERIFNKSVCSLDYKDNLLTHQVAEVLKTNDFCEIFINMQQCKTSAYVHLLSCVYIHCMCGAKQSAHHLHEQSIGTAIDCTAQRWLVHGHDAREIHASCLFQL